MNFDEEIDVSEATKRVNKRMELRRRQISEVAAKLFAEKGYNATTLEMIAEELGYSKPSLYHYVKNKEEVLGLVLEDVSNKVFERLELEVMKGDLIVDMQLRKVIEIYVEFATDLQANVVYKYRNAIKGSDVFTYPNVIEARRRHGDLIREILNKGVAEGIFRIENLKIAVHVLNISAWSVADWYDPEGRMTPIQIADILAGIVIGGLKSPCND